MSGMYFPRLERCRVWVEGPARGGMIGIGSGDAVGARGVPKIMEGAYAG